VGNAVARLAARTSTKGDPFNPRMFAERNDRWLTPLGIIEALGTFDLDPAGAPGHATAREVWTPEEVGDGLSLPWHGRVWLNPPYGREQRAWMDRLADHGTGTALIPVATGTKLWQEVVLPRSSGIFFYRHRISFLRRDGGDGGEMMSPAPSALVAFGEADAEALRTADLPGVGVLFQGTP